MPLATGKGAAAAATNEANRKSQQQQQQQLKRKCKAFLCISSKQLHTHRAKRTAKQTAKKNNNYYKDN